MVTGLDAIYNEYASMKNRIAEIIKHESRLED